MVVESGVCKRLVQLLDHPSSQVVKPALRTIGNVVCAEDDADYTEAILEAGSVVCLKKLIAHPNREIQKEVRTFFARIFLLQDEGSTTLQQYSILKRLSTDLRWFVLNPIQ